MRTSGVLGVLATAGGGDDCRGDCLHMSASSAGGDAMGAPATSAARKEAAAGASAAGAAASAVGLPLQAEGMACAHINPHHARGPSAVRGRAGCMVMSTTNVIGEHARQV